MPLPSPRGTWGTVPAVRRGLMIVAGGLVVLLSAGCGAAPGTDAATRAADQWLAAARAKDAAALCRMLTPAAAQSVASGDQTCEQAVGDLDLPGDGFACTKPDPDLIAAFREAGGAGKPMQVGTKVCYGPDEDSARRTAHRIWRNEALPGELAQVRTGADTLFLTKLTVGWRVSGAGCTFQGDEPYDCDVEG